MRFKHLIILVTITALFGCQKDPDADRRIQSMEDRLSATEDKLEQTLNTLNRTSNLLTAAQQEKADNSKESRASYAKP